MGNSNFNQLNRIQKNVDEDRVSREQAMDVKDKELANLETKFSNALENETSVISL